MDSCICGNCTGCAACFNSCPTGAISMEEDSEGFLYPHVDGDRCTDCRLCERVCPVLNFQKKPKGNPGFYAVAASDEIRRTSSSGGVFPVLALSVLRQNGGVVGARFRSDGSVCHVLIDDVAELPKLLGSKYLQSDVSNVYKPVEEFLKSGRKLLFSGTPCQIAGIRSFLGKDDPNLCLVDLVCHGVPSPKVFKKYLRENFPGQDFVSTNFRDKKPGGWSPNLQVATTTTASVVTRSAKEDDFMRAFLQNLCLRGSCGACPFNSLPRQGDLTIGDFWGIDSINAKLNDELGLSEVLVNTEKGGDWLRGCETQFKVFKKMDLGKALPFNPTLDAATRHHGNRTRFFSDIENLPLHEAVERNLKYDYLCLNFWTSTNYGALLTAYALQNVLDGLGYSNAHIDYRFDHRADRFDGSFTDRFARKHLRTIRRCSVFREFEELNAMTERGFVVGSDQVFRDDYIRDVMGLYLLAFADDDKQRVAVSASFGKDSFSLDNADMFFKAFDAISVRERSGLELLKDNGYLAGEHILDPVFLVESKVFEDLAKDVDAPADMVVGYVLDENEEIEAFVKAFGDKYINIAYRDLDVEEFLAYFMRARAVVTDSFHGTCFAVIFNKPFRCFYNEVRGNARFVSLFESLGLPADSLSREPDWERVNRLITEERRRGLAWIARSLEQRKPKEKGLCDKLKKIATQKRRHRHRHSFWWHLIHMKF